MMATTETTIRANNDRRYYFRFLLIGVAALGFALWSLYDGAVKYPRQREQALAFQKLDEESRGDEWYDYARQRGWPTDLPGEPKSEVDITMQYILAAVAATIGVLLLLVVLRSRNRWIEATESGLRSSWGQSFEFDQVVSLNKRRWREKGIAKVKYQQGKRRRRFVLDNYKYDQHSTNRILCALESKIGTDKIFGGLPEPLTPEHDEDSSEPVSGEARDAD